METSQVNDYLGKAKDIFNKHRNAILGGIAAIIVGVVGLNFYNSQPKSVITDIELSFSGYDGYGTLEVPYADIQEEIARVAYKNVGFSSSQVEDLLNNDTLILADIEADNKLQGKYKKAQAIIHGTSYKFNKTEELSNGDKVTLSITTTSSKSPIKKEKKTFKVSGLDPIEKISTKAFLEEYPVTFVGFDGYGRLIVPEDKNNNDLLSLDVTESNGSYKNGDKVTLTVSPAYLSSLQSEGKKLESDKVEVTVEGLKKITDISNVADALARNEVYAKSQYENNSWSTYALEKQKNFIAYNTGYSGDSVSGQVYLVTVFKITETTSSSTYVKYAYYGYRYYVKSDNSLDLETANKESSYSTQDLENLIAELKTEGYKEYSAKAE